jgi:hypothetical protein
MEVPLPSWTKVSIGTRITVPGPHDSIKKLTALQNKMFYINKNITKKKACQSLPYLRSTLKCSWWKNRKNGTHCNQQHYSTHVEINFLMFKKVSWRLIVTYSLVIGGIDAYFYHMGDEFSMAFDFHQADLVHVHTHGRLFTSHTSCIWNSK